MARGVRLDTLQLRVQRAADIESAVARFPLLEITDYLNESLAELYDLIRGAYGQDYYRKTCSFATSSASSSYNLPPDFLDLISVDIPIGGNLVLTARPYMESERNRFKFFPFGAWTMAQPIFYRLTGALDSSGATATTISFIPNPTGVFNINVNYVPTMTKLSDPADTFDGVAGWEQYAVLDAAIKCATKQQQWELVQALSGQKGAMLQRIEKMAAERDGGAAERVHDVYRDNTEDWW